MSNRMNKLLITVYQLRIVISILISYKIVLVNLYISHKSLPFVRGCAQQSPQGQKIAVQLLSDRDFIVYTVSPQASA